MLLDYFIANYLLNKKVAKNKVWLYLNSWYILINLLLYFLVFRKINNHFSGVVIFLLVVAIFQYFRSRRITAYINSRN